MNPIMKAKGLNGQIELYPNKVRILRKGISGFLSHGLKGDKEILISSITSIQFKKAGVFTNGYIQFAFMGGKEAKRGILQAVQDENTVMFTSEQQSDFERIKMEIEKRMQNANLPSSSFSIADEIAKLAELRDRGILTEDEFQRKKKQILGF
ncbi:MAG: SHOCT domain-containing protein [Candidatus Heimdallarchaeaceae archaeon]